MQTIDADLYLFANVKESYFRLSYIFIKIKPRRVIIELQAPVSWKRFFLYNIICVLVTTAHHISFLLQVIIICT